MSHHLKRVEQVSIGGSKIDFAIVDDEGHKLASERVHVHELLAMDELTVAMLELKLDARKRLLQSAAIQSAVSAPDEKTKFQRLSTEEVKTAVRGVKDSINSEAVIP